MAVHIPVGLRARGPAPATPTRRPGSVRRTATIDMRWPGGPGTALQLTGRARDLLTPLDAESVVLAEDSMHVELDRRTRTIAQIASDPPRPGIEAMVGARGGGKFRGVLATALPEEAAAGSPLYLLLDDIAGATLISGFAQTQWMDRELLMDVLQKMPRRDMTGVCTGFQPGSDAMFADGSSKITDKVRVVDPLPLPDDPVAWHAVEEITEVSMRRARRIDVFESDVVEIDSMFQDSATTPDGGRVAVHEYRVTATADPVSGELLRIEADPRVLPYDECPLASLTVDKVVGTSLRDLRTVVLEQFQGTAGCTHLNDAMRALAEVPVLLRALRDG